jgi:hypothetical protein
MRFFVPCAESRAESEQIWGQLRARLFDLGLPTTRRRIQALALGSDGDWILLEVGMETPDEETVLAIFEASNIDLFYVCTPQRMLEAGLPLALGLTDGAPVIDFDAGVVGHA